MKAPKLPNELLDNLDIEDLIHLAHIEFFHLHSNNPFKDTHARRLKEYGKEISARIYELSNLPK